MEIKIDNLSGREIDAFPDEHIKDMKSASPPESKHATGHYILDGVG